MKNLFLIICIFIFQINLLKAQSGTTIIGAKGIQATCAQIMARKTNPNVKKDINIRMKRMALRRKVIQNRSTHIIQNLSQFPKLSSEDNKKYDRKSLFKLLKAFEININRHPQKISPPNFVGGTVNESGFFPPDSMGAIGPNQFLVVINGLVRTFNKKTGAMDGILNIDLSQFYSFIINPSQQEAFDSHVRFDKLTNRWFIISDSVNIANNARNWLLLAVSNSGNITNSTIWTFFIVKTGIPITEFFDFPTFGLDKNALYLGGDVFPSVTANKIFVVKKSSVLGTGPIVYTVFKNLIDSNGSGPWLPQGVVNFDKNATIGYFISPDNISSDKLVIRKVFNPGGTPTISPNIFLNVPFFNEPITVPNKGNNLGSNGNLAANDSRLLDSHIRDGHLWTTQNIGVTNTGFSPGNSNLVSRDGCRFYEIDLNATGLKLIQMGTLFQPSANNTKDQASLFFGGIMTSGQNHMALGCSRAGLNEFANSGAAGRLRTDPLGTIRPATLYTHATTAYNPTFDRGGKAGRRWGDYSYTTVDPDDNMTMWTIQEYCNALGSWGVKIVKLLAPPPAIPISITPSTVKRNQSQVKVLLKGKMINGSGFYDPGIGFKGKLKVAITGGVIVKQLTCLSPTEICLTISTVHASLGLQNVTVINPDGQRKTGAGLINIVS